MSLPQESMGMRLVLTFPQVSMEMRLLPSGEYEVRLALTHVLQKSIEVRLLFLPTGGYGGEGGVDLHTWEYQGSIFRSENDIYSPPF